MIDIEATEMLSKKQVIQMIVGLIEVSDFSLIEEGVILNTEVCAEKDIENIKALAGLIRTLHSEFDYLSSSEFLTSVEGKTEAFKKMKTSMVGTPSGKKKYRALFGEAICDLSESVSRIDLLIKPEHKPILDKARSMLLELSNPI